MKNSLAILLTSFLLIFVACSENKSATQNSENVQSEEIQATLDTPSTENISIEQVVAEPGVIQPSAPAAVQSTSTSGALNPAHGEPGHDCSIAVGAPLSSAKSNGSQSIQMANPSPGQGTQTINPASAVEPVMAVPSNQNPAGTSGKLNPAHGEPGHDCAKPVGAPL